MQVNSRTAHFTFARRLLGTAVLAFAVAALLGAGWSQSATATGTDIVLLDLSGTRAAVDTPYTFAYEVTNNGPDAATDLRLTAVLDGSFAFESASTDVGTCGYTTASRTVACDIGALPDGASTIIEIVVTPSGQAGSTTTVSTVDDPDTSNNSARSVPEVLPAGSADLWVYPNGGLGDQGVGSAGYAIAGEPFDYAIDVVNYGPAVAEDVDLSILLPEGVELDSAESGCVGTDEEGPGTVVTCSLGSIETGRTVNVAAVAPVGTAGQTLRTEVFVDGSGLDPGPARNDATNLLAVVAGLSAGDASGNEGAAATNIPVELSEPVQDTVTVDYASADGTAKAGADYRQTRGTLTFAPGETTQIVSVPIIRDRRTEQNETFFLRLSDVDSSTDAAVAAGPIPTAALVRDEATATILDDDPKIRIADARGVEGDSGRHKLTFRITLSHASPASVTARLQTTNGTARAGSDYAALRKTIRLLAGRRTQTVTVWIKGDRMHEGNERFIVKLSHVRGALLGDGKATGMVVDDD